MEKQKGAFVSGCANNDISAQKASDIFDTIERFAGYGFNKSHSAAYALITYQTACLKCFYPIEFMAALLTTELSSTDNVVKYIHEARAHGIEVLPPDFGELLLLHQEGVVHLRQTAWSLHEVESACDPPWCV